MQDFDTIARGLLMDYGLVGCALVFVVAFALTIKAFSKMEKAIMRLLK